MGALGRYDSSLQMFVEGPREPDGGRLRFLRWLIEQGRLDQAPAGPPAGEYAAEAMASGATPEWSVPITAEVSPTMN
jgi:hypothetical protein